MRVAAFPVPVAVLVLAAACSRSEAADEPARGVSRADYDRWRRPDDLVAALEVQPGDTVADVGAGRGYLTGRLARAVGPTGRVVATDVVAAALAEVKRLPRDERMAPIETRLVAADRTGLEEGRYDVILLAEVDHLLPDRVAYLGRLRAALAAGGRVAVANRLQHRAGLLVAAERAGYQAAARAAPPGQYLVLLEPGP